MKTAEQVVQQNINAYNQRDIAGFMACVSDEIKLFSLGESEPSLNGKAEIEAFYAELFEQSPTLHSEILNRIVIGNTVIDHESISGRLGSDGIVELVLVYEVSGQQIDRISVIRE